MKSAIAIETTRTDTVLAMPTVPIQEARIGSSVRFLSGGTWWCGRVMDVRPHISNLEHDLLSVAVLGWPNMFTIERDRGGWVTEANGESER